MGDKKTLVGLDGRRKRAMAALCRVCSIAALTLAFGGIPGARLRSAMAPGELAHPNSGPSLRASVEVLVGDESAAHLPLPSATVQVLMMAGERGYRAGSAETDASGRAHFAGLPTGEAWVLVDAPGRAQAALHLVLAESVAEEQKVAIALVQEQKLRVAVHDEDGRAVPGAGVEAFSSGSPMAVGARVGADGTTTLGRLSAGPFHLTVRALGYEDAEASAQTGDELVTFVLRKLGALVVRVIGPDERPAASAQIEVGGAAMWPARSTKASEGGEARISGLPAGLYALRAVLAGDVSATELGVALERGEEKVVVLRLRPGRYVNVRVRAGRADGAEAVPGARIALTEGGVSPFPLEATADAQGRARLGPVAAGTATVSARADGFMARGLVGVPDPSPAVVEVALVRGGALSGRVLDARGRPIEGATIEVSGSDEEGAPILDDPRRARFQAAHFETMLGGPVSLLAGGELGVMAGPVPAIPRGLPALGLRLGSSNLPGPGFNAEPWVSRADGTFRVWPVTPGRIRALVHHPQFVDAESALVPLAPGGEESVNLIMRAGGVLEGRVLDAHDRPVAGARLVVAATRGSLERAARSGSDGTFAFAALPEELTLSAQAYDDDGPEVRLTLSVPEGGRRQATVRLPEPRGSFPVDVVGGDGRPVEAAQVGATALTLASSLRETAFTDRAGAALLRHALGLPLRVEVHAPGRAPRLITTDGRADALRVELAEAARASGEVVQARGGSPIADAEVTLFTEVGVRHARSDARGMFTVGDLAPGPTRVSVRSRGFAPLESSLALVSSDVTRAGRRDTAPARLEMAPEARISGTVVNGHGDPVSGARVAQDVAPTYLLVGSTPAGVAVTDADGHFELGELPEGRVTLEAFAPDVGRGQMVGVPTVAERTTESVHLVLAATVDAAQQSEPSGSGSLAVTLGESGAGSEVAIVAVVPASQAERSGVLPGDLLLAVDEAPVASMEDARAKLTGPLATDVLLRVRRGQETRLLRSARDAVRK